MAKVQVDAGKAEAKTQSDIAKAEADMARVQIDAEKAEAKAMLDIEKLDQQERLESARIAAKVAMQEGRDISQQEIEGFKAGFSLIKDIMDDDETREQ